MLLVFAHCDWEERCYSACQGTHFVSHPPGSLWSSQIPKAAVSLDLLALQGFGVRLVAGTGATLPDTYKTLFL